MNFLHTEFVGGPSDLALVTLDAQANVMLLDDTNFSAYKSGRSFRYYGGWVTHSPVKLSPPHQGRWHVIVDIGRSSGSVRAAVRIVHAQQTSIF